MKMSKTLPPDAFFNASGASGSETFAGRNTGESSLPLTLSPREVYDLLRTSPEGSGARRAARSFLQACLKEAAGLPHDLPEHAHALDAWMEGKTLEAGDRYAEYLEGRKQGQPRRYFTNKSHALYFLQHVAPTKLVDGAWLYGILPYWKDPRFHGLIRTYLEELGDGMPEQNHALLFQRLLDDTDCDTPLPLSDAHYLQGAIQLSLAHDAERFLPELIGYNLGYEQLPLHLLITAFELGELEIDPYYFTLHVTVDNASTGHARKAVQAVNACLPVSGDAAAFWRRVLDGYRLNDLGPSAEGIARGFDLERELVLVLERKRVFGRHVHSDYSRIGGHTVNEWLAEPGRMPDFLKTMEARQWILRHRDPHESRFWGLIEGPKAPMAGVFNGYEKQLLHDWIAGESLHPNPAVKRSVFRRYRDAASTERADATRAGLPNDADPDVQDLRRRLAPLAGDERMRLLIEFMSPSRHVTPAGLLATREFAAALNPAHA